MKYQTSRCRIKKGDATLFMQNIEKGLPCEEGNFIRGLEKIAGRLFALSSFRVPKE